MLQRNERRWAIYFNGDRKVKVGVNKQKVQKDQQQNNRVMVSQALITEEKVNKNVYKSFFTKRTRSSEAIEIKVETTHEPGLK